MLESNLNCTFTHPEGNPWDGLEDPWHAPHIPISGWFPHPDAMWADPGESPEEHLLLSCTCSAPWGAEEAAFWAELTQCPNQETFEVKNKSSASSNLGSRPTCSAQLHFWSCPPSQTWLLCKPPPPSRKAAPSYEVLLASDFPLLLVCPPVPLPHGVHGGGVHRLLLHLHPHLSHRCIWLFKPSPTKSRILATSVPFPPQLL